MTRATGPSPRWPRWLSLAAACAVLAALPSTYPLRAQDPVTPALTGQSITALPDGRELIIGGLLGTQAVQAIWVRDPATGVVTLLTTLTTGRAFHSATVLPDGQVLVLGGTDGSGGAVGVSERLDLTTATVEVVPDFGWSPSGGHTATVLNGHELLVAGGVIDGQLMGTLDVIDLQTAEVRPLGTLPVPRANHTAALLADGQVALWGGDGPAGALDATGVAVDLAGPTVVDLVTPVADPGGAWIAGSDPAEGASAVGLTPVVGLRLSRLVHLPSVSQTTVTLTSAAGTVAASVVPAEQGRLVFLTPTEPLQPQTPYLVTLTGVLDAKTLAPLPVLTLTFTTGDGTDAASLDQGAWDPATASGWRTGLSDSPFQALPPLMAAEGVTAISGQVLRIDGEPLAGVRLEIDGVETRTDGTGRFLLIADGLSTGWHELCIDGRRGLSPAVDYGMYEAAVHVTAGMTAVLPYTSWLTRIDVQHAVTISSPTTTDTVITTPRIPGLELHLPSGTVIRDEDGQVARDVSITPLPLDRTPFPLPVGVDVPIYFTIQPGGAYVEVQGTGTYRRGARLIYPNYKNRPPGTRMEFWHYDPEEGRRWYVYGEGAVGAEGQQVVPDYGVYIYEFTGAMVAPPSWAADLWGAFTELLDGDPVELSTGLFILRNTDVELPDVLPIGMYRTYRPNDSISRAFGIGATHLYDVFLVGDTNPWTYVELVLPDGKRVHYDRISPGTEAVDAIYEHTSSPTAFFKSQISWNGDGWDLDLKDGTLVTFGDGFLAIRPQQGAVTGITDRYGNTIELTRNTDFDLTRIVAPHGRWIDLTYDTSHRVTELRDNINRTVQYVYDASGRLSTVTDVNGGVTEYTYDAAHRMLTVEDPRDIIYLTNQYDAEGRISQQTQADSTTFLFTYVVDGGGQIIQTDVTHPEGDLRRATFNAERYPLTDVWARTLPEEQPFSWEWQVGTNLLLADVDALNRRTEYAYDALGNQTNVTRLAGTADAVTQTYTYDPIFSQLTSVTDALMHTTTFGLDSLGSVTTITDPLMHQTLFTYNAAGQVTSVTDPLSQRTDYSYSGGDLVGSTDPLGQVTSAFVDAAGRLLALTSPRGYTTVYDYNAKNQVTRVTDPVGGQTDFTYDPNGRLLTLTDARTGATTYTYDSMDRVDSRTDALLRGETYLYDDNGNLQQVTDRKGQVTAYAYDGLDRLVTLTYDDASTTTQTYDAGDRLVQIVDSLAGTITRGYDLLDRMTSETTPEGAIVYTYDDADRRETMTVAGQPVVTYSYDIADRLTGITQNAAAITLDYDDADRRTSLTLPNGVVVAYDYDTASRLTGLTYTLAPATLGTLTYAYDADGNRTSVGGTWAATGLPAALTAATYDAANQLTQWGGATVTYDANGNLSSDGARTYTWNARDELAALSGPVAASFQYDGLGRRRAKTVGGTTTGFLYDELNLAQELVGGQPAANLLTGLELDEVFTRTDTSGAEHLLADALGSTVALTDAAGAVQTQYIYEPFGATTVTGSSDSAVQFTGRENDGTGLYFYRARYQHPVFQRFISEDPIEFAAGDPNLHTYVFNAPTVYSDPTGELAAAVAVAVGWGAVSVASDLIAGRKIDWPAAAVAAIPGPFGKARAIGKAARATKAAREGANATKGLQKQLAKHMKKLKDYKANPDRFDNKGFLENASPELRQKIIDSRVRSLEKQIENFRRLIERAGGVG